MRPDSLLNASQTAKDKLAELEFVFPTIRRPEDAPERPAMPDARVIPELPELTAPSLPELTLPEQAHAEIDIPAANLPEDIFGGM